jgi:hypothetical protein
VTCDTAYPFGTTLTYSVSAASAFDFFIRVPSWSASTSVAVNGAQAQQASADATSGLVQISLPAGQSTIVFSVSAAVRTEARQNGAVSVYVGNVLYGLDVGQTNTSSPPHPYSNAAGAALTDLPYPQLRDYYVENTQNWAVAIDPSTLAYSAPVSPSPAAPFTPGADAGSVSVAGCTVDWDLYLGATPDAVPANATCNGPQGQYRLVPYGQAKVHMSELPVVDLAQYMVARLAPGVARNALASRCVTALPNAVEEGYMAMQKRWRTCE